VKSVKAISGLLPHFSSFCLLRESTKNDFTAFTMTITLIGPGGAGKSTVGAVLAQRVRVSFVDLDRQFTEHHGDISAYILRFGYDAYARENVETYCSLPHGPCVVALSSGFMTYAERVHPEYVRVRHRVEASATTVVLVPSLDGEQCVHETVRRQLTRSFARSAAEEEAVIRERFPLYVGVAAPKVETMQPLDLIVQDVLSARRSRAKLRLRGSR